MLSNAVILAVWHGVPLAVAWLAVVGSLVRPNQFIRIFPWTLRYYATIGYVLVFIVASMVLAALLESSWWHHDLVDHGLDPGTPAADEFLAHRLWERIAAGAAFSSIMASPIVGYSLGHWWRRRRAARRAV